jgi:NDP-sugar pyrophosphorylase family protein
MRGIPKFLLPCDEEYLTLLERHVHNMLKYCKVIWIPTRPDLTILIETLGITSERVVVVPMVTKSMTETILKVAAISSADDFMLCMPDTYFEGELPYQNLRELQGDLKLACWAIRPEQKGKLGQILFESGNNTSRIIDSRDKDPGCTFDYSWGAMSFRRELLKIANPEMPHTGYLIKPAIENRLVVDGFVVKGNYFDCGTPNEYLQMLRKVTSE